MVESTLDGVVLIATDDKFTTYVMESFSHY